MLATTRFARFFNVYSGCGDSQSITAEAAVLGTPALRLNSFVGRISYLEELEDYGLAFGYHPGHEADLLAELESVLGMSDRREVFRGKRNKMLEEKIDPVPFMAKVLKYVADGVEVDREACYGV